MKVTQMFFKTYRENPADAEIKSHQLLLRAGYIKKQAAGIYVFLPLGLRALNKLSQLIRNEMDKSGAQEVLMSCLLPMDVYQNRLDHFGADMFRLQDRTGKEMCLGPSHEEIFNGVVKDVVKSYKQLPLNLYQIQTKFRDEVRPRFGLMRGKEFLMKDAYSFDKDAAGLDQSYNIMRKAYKNIFTKLGLDFVVVEADNGNMGGASSHEFMVKSDIGEDDIVVCDTCAYAANTEKAECIVRPPLKIEEEREIEKKSTPNAKTIEELVSFLNTTADRFLKAVVYKSGKNIVVALVPGDREVEDVKLSNASGLINLDVASHEDIESIGSVAGFVGAIDLKNCVVIGDNSVKFMKNFVIGANESDYHFINANLKDIKIDKFADIKTVKAGDKCIKCGAPLKVIKGIEVGHIFKQDTKYSAVADCSYLDEFGKKVLMQTGAYGIGVTRTLSAVIEQYSKDDGILLPEIIAPYRVAIICAKYNDDALSDIAEKLYDEFQFNDIETIYDNRQENIGVKIKDMSLIGVPNIVIIGRDAVDGKCELINRLTSVKTLEDIENIVEKF